MTVRGCLCGLLCSSLLVGCSGGGGATPTPAPAVTVTETTTPQPPTSAATSKPDEVSSSTPDDDPVTAAPFDANTEDDTQEPVGNVGLVAVEYDSGPGFESLRFRLDGTDEVGWAVGYTDDPRSDGSGDPVVVKGDAVLSVVLRGITIPFDAAVERDPKDPDVSAASVLVDAVDDAWFEGHWTFFLGLDERRPFRVFQEGDEIILQVDITS